jgi:hypothetical protein
MSSDVKSLTHATPLICSTLLFDCCVVSDDKNTLIAALVSLTTS